MIPMMVFSMAMQAAKSASEASSANKLKNMSNAINPNDPKYNTSPYAQQRLGLANTLLNARMPGATAMERNIYGNQANQMENVNRNATSGSQALAMGAAAQGQTNQAFQNLGVQEQQDYYNRLQNVTGAQQGMTQEGDKAYQDQLRDYQEKMSLKNAYLASSMQNKTTAFNSLANTGLSGGMMASMWPKRNNSQTYAQPADYNGIQTADTSGGMGGVNFPDPNSMQGSGGMGSGMGGLMSGIGGMWGGGNY